MKKFLIPYLMLMAFLAACNAEEPYTIQEGKAEFAPTSTTEITAVPLLLTPINTPSALPKLPAMTNSQSSKMLALAGDMLVTVNMDSDSVTLVDVAEESVIAEISVGDDPRTVAITPDNTYALITLRGDNAIAIVNLDTQELEDVVSVCHMPYGVVVDERRAYVSCFADDIIVVLNLESHEILYRMSVQDAPAGLVISGNWLLSTHFYSGFVTVFNIERTPVVVGSVNVEPDGNLASTIVFSPDGERAYIPQTRTGLALVSLQFMQDWFPVIGVLDLETMSGDRDARLTISMVDGAANMPFDAAFADDGQLLYVTLAGNDTVLAIDLESQQTQARFDVGANPRGIVLDGKRIFVSNVLDGTLSIISTTEETDVKTIQVTDLLLDPLLLRGKVLFHQADAPIMSDGAISCATCHFDGGMDGRTWINFRSGPRNTPALGGIADMSPYNWSGDMNELHDTIEDQIRNVMLGDGLIHDGSFDPTIDFVDTGRSEDLDALVTYVVSLEPWSSPYREPDGSLSESAQRGMQLFLSGSPNCGCHTPPLYTDLEQHNLAGAAFSVENYGEFDTPTLRGLWATAPYMHDGVAQTLEEVLTRTDPVHSVADTLTDQQLADLVAFLLSL